MAIMRYGVQLKYSLIRYYYTQLSMISQGSVAALYKPLFFEFPNDIGAYADQERNVMLGEALKLSILSNELDQNTTSFYFP